MPDKKTVDSILKSFANKMRNAEKCYSEELEQGLRTQAEQEIKGLVSEVELIDILFNIGWESSDSVADNLKHTAKSLKQWWEEI